MMCANCRNQNYANLFDALESIAWYDGHYIWLKELYNELLQTDFYPLPMDIELHAEIHTIWMLLVGMFGNWGTSIRGGWIEKTSECADFIEALCKDMWEEEDE